MQALQHRHPGDVVVMEMTDHRDIDPVDAELALEC